MKTINQRTIYIIFCSLSFFLSFCYFPCELFFLLFQAICNSGWNSDSISYEKCYQIPIRIQIKIIQEFFSHLIIFNINYGRILMANINLTLSGLGTFHLVSLLDQILSAEYFQKTLLKVKIEINRVIWTPCPTH